MLLGPFLNIMLGALDKHSVQKLVILTKVMILVYRLFFNNAPVSLLYWNIPQNQTINFGARGTLAEYIEEWMRAEKNDKG